MHLFGVPKLSDTMDTQREIMIKEKRRELNLVKLLLCRTEKRFELGPLRATGSCNV